MKQAITLNNKNIIPILEKVKKDIQNIPEYNLGMCKICKKCPAHFICKNTEVCSNCAEKLILK